MVRWSRFRFVRPAAFAAPTLFILVTLVTPRAASAGSHIVYVSPVPGARNILPQSNIIVRFRNDPGTVRGSGPTVTVRGSKTGYHAGTLVRSGDGTLVFKPLQPFAWNERVSVMVSPPQALGETPAPYLEYGFAVSRKPPPAIPSSIEAELQEAQNATAPPAPRDEAGSNFERLSVATPPAIISAVHAEPSDGALFLSSWKTLSGPPSYLLIVDDLGNPLFYRSEPAGCIDFKTQPNGMLTYYAYAGTKFYEMDTTYAVVDSFATGNGYKTDGHELRLLPNGHALLLSYDPEIVDMRTVVAGGDSEATVVGAILQELDENKNVVFQWRSWDHFQITDATHEDLTAAFIDYVHANAIEIADDGNLLLSSRHLDEITKIDRVTGDILWRFGGKNNQFTFLDDPDQFSHQHGVREQVNGDITLFDNGNFHTPPYSRGLEYELDTNAMTAHRVWQYRHSPDIASPAMGFVQRLDNGSSLISWGFGSPALTEVDEDGNCVLEMTLPSLTYTYRSFRQPWYADTLALAAPKHDVALSPLSPNPTRGSTSLVVNVLRESGVSVKLFDLHGRMVQDVAEEARRPAGLYRASLDLSRAAPGVYFLKVAAGRQVETRKVVRLK